MAFVQGSLFVGGMKMGDRELDKRWKQIQKETVCISRFMRTV